MPISDRNLLLDPYNRYNRKEDVREKPIKVIVLLFFPFR